MNKGYYVLLGTVLVCVYVLFSLASQPGTSARLKDGLELHVLGVNLGTNQFTYDPLLYRLGRQILPLNFQSRLPEPIAPAPHGYANGMNVWLRLKSPAPNAHQVPPWVSIEIVNQAGEIIQASTSIFSRSSDGRSHHYYASLLNFPRRQKEFLMRFYDANHQLVATLSVPNPYKGPFPQWKPDPLPITKTNGELAVTFKGIQKIMKELPWGVRPHLIADYDLRWNGLDTSDWRASFCLMEDATGNQIGSLYPGLSEAEPVWRLQQYFFRTAEANFAPDEHFVISNLAVPTPGSYTNLNLFTNMQGVGLCLFTWTGKSVLTISNDSIISATPPLNQVQDFRQESFVSDARGAIITMNFGRPGLLIAQDRFGLEFSTSYIFRDERGNRISAMNPKDGGFISFMTSHSSGAKSVLKNVFRSEYLVLQPEMTADVKTVSLEVIVQRSRFLHFYCTPPRDAKRVN